MMKKKCFVKEKMEKKKALLQGGCREAKRKRNK
jgi:hypothetical protein